MPTFFDHLAELRSKLLLCLAAVTLGAVVAHAEHAAIIALLLKPVRGQSLVFLSPLDPLLFIFKIDLSAGFLFALPVISWSTLSFLKPAMQRSSWLLFCAVFCLAAVLLLAGLAYSYLVIVPLTLRVLTSISVPGIGNMITADSYLSFLLLQLLLMAALFQISLFVLGGVWLGAFDPSMLAAKRRYIYVGGLIALAVITPTTDVFSLGCVAVPALVIFEGSLLAARLLLWRSRRSCTLPSGDDSVPRHAP
jgi:sec-independent protein translocase protein TatC